MNDAAGARGPASNPYQPPAATLEHPPGETRFFATSTRKLTLLYLATFGIYYVYWFYRHWRALAPRYGKRVWPAVRGFFAVLYVYPLFLALDDEARRHDTARAWSAAGNAGVFVAVSLGSWVVELMIMRVDHYTLIDALAYALMVIGLVPMWRAQRVANALNGDPRGELNARFTPANWAFMMVGALVWLLMALSVVVHLFLLPQTTR